MVSLDDAVIARLEKGGSRYEILVDPELVDAWKEDHTSVDIDDLLAVSEVWTDSRNGERAYLRGIGEGFRNYRYPTLC